MLPLLPEMLLRLRQNSAQPDLKGECGGNMMTVYEM